MFSYNEFKNIINLIKVYLPIVDFADVTGDTTSFCVLRHDIEFSIDRALKMARIEADELGVVSTYTVQLRNNTYNALSEKNINLAQQSLENDFKPIDDMRASSKYRMKVAKNLLIKCFQEIKNKKLIRINA